MTDNIETPEQEQQGQWWEQEQPPVVYAYSPITGEYTGNCVVDPSPLEPGVWLYPAHTTDTEPPQTGEHEAVIWTGEAWQVVPDWRGHVYYTQNGERREITELGVAPTEDALDEPPPPTPEQIMSRLEARVQLWLDEQAQALGYDDIKSAVTYADEPAFPKFQQEGQALRRLRSLVWARCYEILNAVQAGQRSIPTEAELIAEMEALR